MTGWEVLEEFRPSDASLKRRPSAPSFFSAISRSFRVENYHSEIIAYLLRTASSNLERLIKALRVQKEFPATIESFPDYEVLREKGRIDIAVRSPKSKKAILIENKSNQAADQDRQLPRYLAYYHRLGYVIEAIVYINLCSLKKPAKTKWTTQDADTINEKLHVARLYGEANSLSADWLKPIATGSEDEDSRFVAKHFARLINDIVCGGLNMEELHPLHRYMLDMDGFRKLKELNSLLDGYPLYLTSELMQAVHDACSPPFSAPYPFEGSLVIDFKLRKRPYAIQVYQEPPDQVWVTILDKGKNPDVRHIDGILKQAKASSLLQDTWKGHEDRRCKRLPYPEGLQKAPELLKTIILKIQRSRTLS